MLSQYKHGLSWRKPTEQTVSSGIYRTTVGSFATVPVLQDAGLVEASYRSLPSHVDSSSSCAYLLAEWSKATPERDSVATGPVRYSLAQAASRPLSTQSLVNTTAVPVLWGAKVRRSGTDDATRDAGKAKVRVKSAQF